MSDTKPTTPAATKIPKVPKSASITLKAAGGGTMLLLAERKPDGTATTSVTVTDGAKKKQVGMREHFPTFDAARARLTALATEGRKLGWAAAGRGVRPDAFHALPAPPSATTKKGQR